MNVITSYSIHYTKLYDMGKHIAKGAPDLEVVAGAAIGAGQQLVGLGKIGWSPALWAPLGNAYIHQ